MDVDLIFGIPGQGADAIKAGFRTAVSCGATQISTYPFIDFTYEHNKRKPVGRRQKRALLDAILDVSNELGFERTSVWTFAKRGTDRHSYNLEIGRPQYAELLRIVERRGGTYALTRKGAYLFHLIEQQYANQYIDKVWRLATETAGPKELVIRMPVPRRGLHRVVLEPP